MHIYTKHNNFERAMNFISLTTRVYLSIMVLLLIPFLVWNVERLHNIVLKVYCYLASAKIRFIYINIFPSFRCVIENPYTRRIQHVCITHRQIDKLVGSYMKHLNSYHNAQYDIFPNSVHYAMHATKI